MKRRYLIEYGENKQGMGRYEYVLYTRYILELTDDEFNKEMKKDKYSKIEVSITQLPE